MTFILKQFQALAWLCRRTDACLADGLASIPTQIEDIHLFICIYPNFSLKASDVNTGISAKQAFHCVEKLTFDVFQVAVMIHAVKKNIIYKKIFVK